MANKIQPVKGTREFYPEQMALRNFIYKRMGEAATSFGYQEWDAPFIEPIDLYAAKSGEELVKKQSFTFTDRGGDFVTLRPELTPSLARMIAAKQGELTFPVRWWSLVLSGATNSRKRDAAASSFNGTWTCLESILPKRMRN
jgi:histidyl-tRNA synthetase